MVSKKKIKKIQLNREKVWDNHPLIHYNQRPHDQKYTWKVKKKNQIGDNRVIAPLHFLFILIAFDSNPIIRNV